MTRLQKVLVLASIVAPLLVLAFRLGQFDAWAEEPLAWTPREVEVIR